jgi:uncharacterized protein (DUF2147 family)
MDCDGTVNAVSGYCNDHKIAARMRHLGYCMMKLKFITIMVFGLAAAVAFAAPLHAAEPSVAGLWEQFDNHGHGWFLFFERDGVYQGAIVKMFTKPNEPANPICTACSGDQKNAPFLGLVIVKGMERHGLSYENGKILDPRSGSVYNAKMKVSPDGQRLTLRGYLGIDLFGQDQLWKRLPDDALPLSEMPPTLMQYLATPPTQPGTKQTNSGSGPPPGSQKPFQPFR